MLLKNNLELMKRNNIELKDIYKNETKSYL